MTQHMMPRIAIRGGTRHRLKDILEMRALADGVLFAVGLISWCNLLRMLIKER
jgi:hypothetical protein